MHRSPVIVYPQFLSSTVFRIIRSLGLRHIVVGMEMLDVLHFEKEKRARKRLENEEEKRNHS